MKINMNYGSVYILRLYIKIVYYLYILYDLVVAEHGEGEGLPAVLDPGMFQALSVYIYLIFFINI